MRYIETAMKYIRFNFSNDHLYSNFSLDSWIHIDQNFPTTPPYTIRETRLIEI